MIDPMSSRALRKNRLAPKAHRKALAAERKELLGQVPNVVHPPTLSTRYGDNWARARPFGHGRAGRKAFWASGT